MLYAIAGAVIGSVYEARTAKTTDFEPFPPGARFTDDTVLTVVTTEALLGDGDYAGAYRRFGLAFPNAGYGGSFYRWLFRSVHCIVRSPDYLRKNQTSSDRTRLRRMPVVRGR